MKIITVVIPSYNQSEFIEDTIRSVLAQEGNFYIDLIIMDGKSIDPSVEIIKKYETLLIQNCSTMEHNGLKFYLKKSDDFRYNHCLGVSYRWTSEPDNGQVDALKKGFRLAVGEIYCWLNSDDIYLETAVFKKVWNYFDENSSIGLLFGDGLFLSRSGEPTGIHHVDEINLKELLYLDYHILQPSAFFRKALYNESYLDEAYFCAFDADFFIRLIKDGAVYRKVEDRFSGFRFYESNKTNAYRKKRYEEIMRVVRTYSRDFFLIWVSAFYRGVEVMLHPSPLKKGGIRHKLFVGIRRFCYFLVIGRWGR